MGHALRQLSVTGCEFLIEYLVMLKSFDNHKTKYPVLTPSKPHHKEKKIVFPKTCCYYFLVPKSLYVILKSNYGKLHSNAIV